MNLLKKLAICAALGLYALVVAELCVRWMAPTPLMPRYITGTPWGVRGNIPGASYRHVTAEVDVGYRINSQGMRADREFTLVPDPKLCRIALIGDSFFMGYELDLQDTFATQLELALNSLGRHTEVLNFSVSGLGTAEMLRAYEGQIRRFSPDAVVMQWHSTDIDDNLRSNLYALDSDELRRAGDSYLPSVEVQDKLMRWKLYRLAADHSQLYSVARETLASAVKNALSRQRTETEREKTAEVPPQSPAPRESPGIELAARLVERLRNEVEKDGHRFLAVDIPDRTGTEAPISAWPRMPAAIVGGVPVIHAGAVFHERLPANTRLFYEKGHYHLTPIAAKALAEGVAEALHAQLPAACGRP